MFERRQRLAGRVAGAVDLLVDLATLGEYGLEPLPSEREARGFAVVEAGEDGRCELDGQRAGWEALATSRRGSCRDVTRGRSQRARAHQPA
jgi:hypothetical protein